MSKFIKKLFCPHKHKRFMLWYSIGASNWDNYLIKIHRTEICEHCGRIKTKITGTQNEIYIDAFNYKRMLLESQGYLTERDYLDELDEITKELELAKK